MKKLLFILLLCCFASMYVAHFTSGETPSPAPAEEVVTQGPYCVTRVVDGDTIVIDKNGDEVTVRLIGVNTPESVHPDENKNVPEGKVASDFTKSKLEGQMIYVEYDEESTDKYGRDLAYVYLGGKMFNETLIEEGYAEIMCIEPNTRYAELFEEIA